MHPITPTNCATLSRLHVGRVQLSSPTCYVDAIPRAGDVGELQRCAQGYVIAFDRGAFVASFDGTMLDACTSSQFPFSDGCTWRSLQRIEGTIRDGLTFTYSETHIEGQNCSPSSCRASATLTVGP